MSAVATRAPEVAVSNLEVSAYEVPTDEPESDGTLQWDSTTIIVVEVRAGDETGLGYSYGDVASAKLIESKLADVVEGADAMSPPAAWVDMQREIRNAGRPGAGAIAISAVDIALWDLKARLLGLCLADALPRFRVRVPIYGSGGFCSYGEERLREQLGGWAENGIPRVKMKIAREPECDPERLDAARSAIGPDVQLLTDANGAYSRKQALEWAHRLRDGWDVTYLEEPLSSEDLEGLRLLRDRGPAGLAIAAGEYAWDLPDLYELIAAGAVDIAQVDATRCGGITNTIRAGGVAKGGQVPLSLHCAPAVSVHVGCAIEHLEHLEYFHDHVRVERMLFDGTLDPDDGYLEPDRSRPGLGLELRRADAERYETS
jgi:L-alanine-DL-glutamate epimerase-like enolase superfamily enzyme